MTSVPATDDRLVCTHPFAWCEIHPDGQVFLCCPAWLKIAVGNLLHSPLAQIWNSSQAQQVRASILDGSFRHCNRKRCPRLATDSAPVQLLAEVTDGEVRQALQNQETVLPYGPKQLNLCFDRNCNLACPSCRRDFLAPTDKERKQAAQLAERIAAEAAASTETITLSGYGDPFGAASYRTLLQNFRREDWPRLQGIHLHSNGQLWDEQMWQTMPGIHDLVRSAEISIDAATAETYAVNRRGGDFATLLKNLDFLQTLPIRVKISCVVQANNFRELPAFVELARRYGFAVYLSQLVNWGTFSREEFRQRAVHLPEHGEHGQLRTLLGELAEGEGVDLGNLRLLADRS